MNEGNRTILVFGASGHQGGAVAASLLGNGWQVRAFVKRDEAGIPASLAEAEISRGDLADPVSIRAAMLGCHGVFSALPSSATAPGMTDEDEVRWGRSIADIAVETGVRHLVYSSSNGVGAAPTGIGHYDGKARIEAHVRGLPIASTIIQPAGFMETLFVPGSGLDKGKFHFFVRGDQPVQLVAVEDIGKVVARVFSQTERFAGRTFEVASDSVTGAELEAALREATGRPIAYSRFPDAFLAANPLFAKMADLLDAGPLAGNADLGELRKIVPDLTNFRTWLTGRGRPLLDAALAPTPAAPEKESP